VALLNEVFFKTRLSLGHAHPRHFTNSIEGGDPDEREVSPAMLELVATAVSASILCCSSSAENTMQVHAALLEWGDGHYQPTEFSYNRSADIYDLHLKTLKAIFTYNLHGFHRTLANIYQEAA
jgi:hypothetical protein